MKIVVLDGHTLIHCDLCWDELKSLGDCLIYERSTPSEVVARAAEAEIAITNKAVLQRDQILALPRLKYIGVTATGYNIVDPEAARERYGEYLARLKGDEYRDNVFASIEQEDSPRPLGYQLDVLRLCGFTQLEVLHKNGCFAAYGACKA